MTDPWSSRIENRDRIARYPRASEVVSRLQRMIEEVGDLEVCVLDGDTGYVMPIGLDVVDEEIGRRFEPPMIAVTSAYFGDPVGHFGHIYQAGE